MHQAMLAISTGNKNKGISVIEILLVLAILSIALTALLGVGAYSLQVSSSINKTELANTLAQEAVEAARSFRGGTTWGTDGLGVITTGVDHPHYPALSGGGGSLPQKWTFPEGTQTINGFTRKIIFDNVSRDPLTSSIEGIYNFSHNDPDTKKATATVSWGNKKVEIIFYLTNWKQ